MCCIYYPSWQTAFCFRRSLRNRYSTACLHALLFTQVCYLYTFLWHQLNYPRSDNSKSCKWGYYIQQGSAAGIWSGFNLKRCVTAHAVPSGCPGKGDVLSLHTSLCFCASDKLVPYVCLCHEVNRGSYDHQCSLPNNNESIPFIFMDSSLFVHLPAQAKCPFPRGTLRDLPALPSVRLGTSSSVHVDKSLLGMERSWLVMSLLWKDLLQSSCAENPLTQRRMMLLSVLHAPPWITIIQMRRKKQEEKNKTKWGCCLS